MATKQDDKRKAQKKLTLNKETLRDLTSRKDKADAVRGGQLGMDTRCNTCSCAHCRY